MPLDARSASATTEVPKDLSATANYLAFRFGSPLFQLLLVVIGQLRRAEVDSQLVDLAVEGERNL